MYSRYLVLLVSILLSCTTKGEIKALGGVVQLVGSDFESTLILKTEDGLNYEITGPMQKELRENYQYNSILVEGKILDSPSPLFDGVISIEKIIAP
jgi:hypothetical protein